LPDLHIVDSSDLKGAAHARNIGAAAAKGDALALVDADDEVVPGWLAAMGEALSKHDFVGGQNEHWNLNEPWVVKCYEAEETTGTVDNHQYLLMVGGNNLGIKRSLHDAIGGFDESILVLEDVDYCLENLRGRDETSLCTRRTSSLPATQYLKRNVLSSLEYGHP